MATLGGQLTINARRHPDRLALVFGNPSGKILEHVLRAEVRAQ